MQDAKDSAFLSAGHCSQDGVCVASGAEAYLCWFVYGAAGAWAAGGGSPKHHSSEACEQEVLLLWIVLFQWLWSQWLEWHWTSTKQPKSVFRRTFLMIQVESAEHFILEHRVIEKWVIESSKNELNWTRVHLCSGFPWPIYHDLVGVELQETTLLLSEPRPCMVGGCGWHVNGRYEPKWEDYVAWFAVGEQFDSNCVFLLYSSWFTQFYSMSSRFPSQTRGP